MPYTKHFYYVIVKTPTLLSKLSRTKLPLTSFVYDYNFGINKSPNENDLHLEPNSYKPMSANGSLALLSKLGVLAFRGIEGAGRPKFGDILNTGGASFAIELHPPPPNKFGWLNLACVSLLNAAKFPWLVDVGIAPCKNCTWSERKGIRNPLK